MESSLNRRFAAEVSKMVIGREDIITLMLAALLSQGHILLEGNPGLGKTTLAKAFAETMGGSFKRVQMTPDTLPADILGTYVFDQKAGTFELRKGPIFGNVILVDELNRATPKAQAALLESMQERQVSFEGETLNLDEPFMVLATQLPYGTTGTYPLSEVQADRFAFSVKVGYPTQEDEVKILTRIDEIESETCKPILKPSDVLREIGHARQVFVSAAVKTYIVSLTDHFRRLESLKMAPGTRASISLFKGSRALAFLEGRDHVLPDDVKVLAPYVFMHRVYLTAEALADEVEASQLISEALENVPVPKEPAAPRSGK
jgi:MoxR-like ATPase